MLTVMRIKPCPFCDWEDVEVDEVDKGLYAICCPECECIGPICGAVENAINMWNGAGGDEPGSKPTSPTVDMFSAGEAAA